MVRRFINYIKHSLEYLGELSALAGTLLSQITIFEQEYLYVDIYA